MWRITYPLDDIMSICRWRKIEYTDDGCTLYECLHCYQRFEGRFFLGDWKFCPYCGAEWKGEHEWLFYDDAYNIIEPARMREERHVSKAEPSWHVELQEMSLFKCDDGCYVPLHDGTAWGKQKWTSIDSPEHFFANMLQGKGNNWKEWHGIAQELQEKYGYKHGYSLYCKRLVKCLFERLESGNDLLFFSSGCDYRLRSTLSKGYKNVVEERTIDLGGWRQLDDKSYYLRDANDIYEHDDLSSHWRDHGHH